MTIRTALLILALGLCMPCGCWLFNSTTEAPSQELTGQSPTSMLLGTIWEDSVRDRALLQGLEPLRVQGYGLVVGLGNRGSGRVPPGVRSVMLAEMRRMRIGTGELGPMGITPEKLLDSKDTVVVRVSGNIPAGAVKGDSFDLTVEVIAGEDDVDLRGGTLYPAQLAAYRTGVTTPVVSTLTLAVGSGDIFVNPFSAADRGGTGAGAASRPGGRSDIRLDEGVVLGGGKVAVPRDLSVILQTASYRIARQIEQRVNDRFPFDPVIAKARSASKIDLDLGRFHPSRREHILAVIGSIYLRDEIRYRQKKLGELIAALKKAPEDLEANELSLALEGMGNVALPQLRNLLTEPGMRTRFYAALAASRLGEIAPTELFGQYAADPKNPYQAAAIEELGRVAHDEKAGSILRKLLPEARGGTRIALYEALRNRDDNGIPAFNIGNRFQLDIIQDDGEPLIYATVRDTPRIAILGRDVHVISPVFFDSTALGLTLNETRPPDQLELVRQVTDAAGDMRFSPPMRCTHAAYNLIGVLGGKVTPDYDEKPGLGFKYSQVVGVLYAMCANRQINATFHLQRAPLPVLELYLPSGPASRPSDVPVVREEGGGRETPESEAERIRREAGQHGD